LREKNLHLVKIWRKKDILHEDSPIFMTSSEVSTVVFDNNR